MTAYNEVTILAKMAYRSLNWRVEYTWGVFFFVYPYHIEILVKGRWEFEYLSIDIPIVNSYQGSNNIIFCH